jgi:hypothetical protein
MMSLRRVSLQSSDGDGVSGRRCLDGRLEGNLTSAVADRHVFIAGPRVGRLIGGGDRIVKICIRL